MHTHLATFIFQIANFLILVAVLRHWLYRPVEAMIARRQKEVEAPLAEATAERARAAELRAEVERQHAAAAAERDRLLLEAGREAEARRDQALAEARLASAELLAGGREALGRERASAESTLQGQAAALAVAIATRLLAADAEGATDRLLDEALRAVEAMDGAARDGIGGPTGPARAQVITAVPLPPARRDDAAGRLRRALGDSLEVIFENDPALVAGAEIHLPAAVVRQSWREQLALAQKSLAER